MKKSTLIFIATVLFIALFYGESIGVNLGILGVLYSVLLFFSMAKDFQNRTSLVLFVLSLLSSFAFAWYGDFVSFLAQFLSISLLAVKSRNQEMKSILALPIFFINGLTFLWRFFHFNEWLPKRNTKGLSQKFISVVFIPIIFISIFFFIYSMGSTHFLNVFTEFKIDLNFWQFLFLACLGFFLAFNLFNFKIYDFLFGFNAQLNNEFINRNQIPKSTFSFLDLDSERKSGVVSLLALNVLLFIFILTFNYEQFVEVANSPSELSAGIHQRVNAVIMSIVMAVVVIMFYFKGNFNFDEKSKSLKLLAKIWIVLNGILVLSAFAKNSEYVLSLGLTYKRLGVFAFLILSIIGLFITYFKIQQQKTNHYLFNQMIWYFYGSILVCSFVNWGGIATSYNLKAGFSNYKYLSTFKYNDRLLMENFPEVIDSEQFENKTYGSFLSRTLYEETLKATKIVEK